MPSNASYAGIIYFKATAAGTAGDEVEGLKDVSHSDSMTILDTTAINDTTTVKTKIMGLQDGSFSLSMDFTSSTVQNLIRTKYAARATSYLTILWDGTNGYRYPVLVTAQDTKLSVDGLAEYSCTMTINGAVTAVP